MHAFATTLVYLIWKSIFVRNPEPNLRNEFNKINIKLDFIIEQVYAKDYCKIRKSLTSNHD